jgi:hypothetical protein
MVKKLVITGGFVVLLLVVLLFVWGRVEGLARHWRVRVSQQEQIAELERRNEVLAQRFAQQIGTEQYLSQVIPTNINVAHLTTQLENLALSAGVGIQFENIAQDSQVASTAGLSYLRVILRATGSASQLLALLDALEHQAGLNEIAAWQLIASPAAPGGYELFAEMGYYFRNEEGG